MMRESEILHEAGLYWVCKSTKHIGYDVFRTGLTHSTRCAIIGYEGEDGLRRAIAEAERRAAIETGCNQ